MMDLDFSTIKPEKISVEFSPQALNQIKVMKANDYTLEGKNLRVQIGGKGCSGFSYQFGFDGHKENDIEIQSCGFKIYMQPFSAYFCQNISIDYLISDDLEADGFSIVNHDQKDFEGKFFK